MTMAAIAIVLSGVAQVGAINLVINGSFENGSPAFNLATQSRQLSAGSTDVTGWTVVTTGPASFLWWNGSLNPGNYASPAADGNLFLYFNGNFTSTDARGEINTSVTFASAGTYRLEFDMWSEPSVNGSRDAGFTAALAGLVSYTDRFTPPFSLDDNNPIVLAANWQHITHDFTVSTPGSYVLSFTDASIYGEPPFSRAAITPSPFLDNVSITAVPDASSTFGLMAVALGALVCLRRLAIEPRVS